MTRIISRYEGQLRTLCTHEGSGQTLKTDAPLDNQGKGEFFSPTDLLATALGSCILTLMGIAAQKLNINISGAAAVVEKTMSTTPPRRISDLKVQIHVPHDVENSARAAIEKAGLGCPVHESLHPDIKQHITFIWNERGSV